MALIAWYPLTENGSDKVKGNDAVGAFTQINKGILNPNSCDTVNSETLTVTINDTNESAFSGQHASCSVWIYEDYGNGVNGGGNIIQWTPLGGTSNRIQRRNNADKASDTIDFNTYLYTMTNVVGASVSDGGSISSTVEKGEWFLFTTVRDGSTIKTYINGELIKTTTLSGPDAIDLVAPSNINIANSRISFTNIQDLRFYDHSLSTKEIKELSLGKILHVKFNSNSYSDSSGYDNPITTSSNLPVFYTDQNTEFGSGCVYIGDNQYVMAMNNVDFPNYIQRNEPTSFAVSFMIPTDAGDISDYRRIISSDQSEYFTISYYSNSASPNNKQILFYVNWGSSAISINTSFEIEYGTWYQAVLTTNPVTGDYAAYVNGELIQSGNDSALTVTNTTSRPLVLGQHVENTPQNNSEIFGYIDDFRIYSSFLSDNDVKSIYNVKGSVDKNHNFKTEEIFESAIYNYIPEDTDFSDNNVRCTITNLTSYDVCKYSVWNMVATGNDSYTNEKYFSETIPVGTTITITISARLENDGGSGNEYKGYMQIYLFTQGGDNVENFNFNATDEWQTFTFEYTTVSIIDRFRVNSGGYGSSDPNTSYQTVQFKNPTVKMQENSKNSVLYNGISQFDDFNEVGITDSMFSYINFMSSTLPYTDVSIQKNILTSFGTPTYKNGGLYNDGTGNGISGGYYIDNTKEILFVNENWDTEKFTLTALITPDSATQSDECNIFAISDNTGISIDDNKFAFIVPTVDSAGDITYIVYGSSAVIEANRTYAISVVKDGKTLKLYQDGVLINTSIMQNTFTGYLHGDYDISVGYDSNSDDYHFNGVIHKTKIHMMVLDDKDIAREHKYLLSNISSINSDLSIIANEFIEI